MLGQAIAAILVIGLFVMAVVGGNVVGLIRPDDCLAKF